MADSVSVSRDINAPAERVWALISDLPRMGEWSEENTGGTWAKGATGPAVGARFVGTNTHGHKRWKTSVTVTVCDVPTAFAFEVKAAGVKVARWSYAIESTPTGCRVTETWDDQRGAVAKALGKPVSGVEDRASHNRAGMETTLANLGTAAEA